MKFVKDGLRLLTILTLVLVCPTLGMSQTTGGITGRAQDISGALVPGVEVTITSPAMIERSRSAFTDEQGSYRFTLLALGVYRVSFSLPGFRTLNIDGVNVTTGNTMTINGTMEVATMAEEVTVTSQAPTIDLEAATVGVNWNKQKLDDLPYGRSVRGLAGLIPGMYTVQYDVGANTMGGSAGFGARVYGRSGGEVNTYDGMQWSQTFGDYGSYEEVQISTAAKGAESQNSGANVSFVIKSGSNTFHGAYLAAWQDDSFQSNNVNDRLLKRGLTVSSNKFTRYNDYNFDLGGPVLKNKLWFYTSYGDTYSGMLVPGFIDLKTGQQVEYSTRLNIPTLKLTYQLNDNMKLETVGQFSRKHTPMRDGSEFVPRESAQNQLSWSGIGPTVKWTYIISPKMTLDASIQRGGYWWPSTGYTRDVRRTDQTTGMTRGSFNENYSRPIRWQWPVSWSYVTKIGGKSNEIKAGYLAWWDKSYSQTDGYPNHQQYRYRSLAGETDYFLHPNSVVVYDTPNVVTSGTYYSGLYFNDKITWDRKLTLNVGLRYDRYSSWLPEQGNNGDGPYSVRLIYPERRDFPVFNSFVPRLSMVYDVKGNGKLALKMSYGRYASGGPTGSNVNKNEGISRTYNNWDGSIPYIPKPADLASVSGGGGDERLDTNLDNTWMDEYTAGVEFGLSRDYVIKFNVIRKMDYGGSKTLNIAQPYEAYTDFRSAVDPGRDNVTGTADDGVMYAWSVPNTYVNFGKIINLTTQVGKNEGNDLYTAYDFAFNKNFSKGWSFLFGYVADFAKVRGNIPTNPNALFYNWQLPSWNYEVKVNGTYSLPWGLKYSGTYQIQSGAYYGRSAQMRNALNSTVTVQVEGRVGRYEPVRLWDSRVSKTFKINDRHSIEGMFDSFNTLNSSAVISQVNTNGPNYLKPLASGGGANVAQAIIPPRIIRLGARWRF